MAACGRNAASVMVTTERSGDRRSQRCIDQARWPRRCIPRRVNRVERDGRRDAGQFQQAGRAETCGEIARRRRTAIARQSVRSAPVHFVVARHVRHGCHLRRRRFAQNFIRCLHRCNQRRGDHRDDHQPVQCQTGWRSERHGRILALRVDQDPPHIGRSVHSGGLENRKCSQASAGLRSPPVQPVSPSAAVRLQWRVSLRFPPCLCFC